MNELERMIAGIRRPGPSQELDMHVQGLLAENVSIHPTHSHLRGAVALLTTATCVGVICFYCGRQSAPGTANLQGVTAHEVIGDPPSQSRSMAGTVIRIPLREDQVAASFTHGLKREGLLGSGPVSVAIFSTQ